MKLIPYQQNIKLILLSFLLLMTPIFVSHPLSYAKVKKSESITLNDPQQQINQSYRVFSNDLNQLIQEIEQASKDQKSAQSIKVKSQLENLKILRKNIENWQPTNQSFLVENELKRMIKAIDNIQFVLEIIDNEGITTNSLYRIQRQIGIRGQGDLEQQFNNLLTYLEEENKKLTISLDEINKNDNSLVIVIIFLIFILIVIVLVIWGIFHQKSKKLSPALEVNSTNPDNILSMVREEISQVLLAFINNPESLSNNQNAINDLNDKISKILQQPKQESLENQENSSLSSPSENLVTPENLVTSEKLKPINSDRFIPLYEEMVNHYNNNNFEPYKPIRVSQIFEPTNYSDQISPKFQPANNGLYYIIQIQIESYLIPIPNVIINQHNQRSFTNVFECFPANFDYKQRFNLIKPALVRQEGEQWRLKEKGVLQFEQI